MSTTEQERVIAKLTERVRTLELTVSMMLDRLDDYDPTILNDEIVETSV